MHNTILDLQNIMNTQKKSTLIHLTETKHNHIKSIWKEVPKDCKLIHAHPTLDPTMNRRSGGTILAARRDIYKEVTAILTPPHIGDYVSAATLIPHDGSPIIAISAYMPQCHTKTTDTIYTEIPTWIHTEIITKFPTMTTLMGGDLQATPSVGDERSYHPSLHNFCIETGLQHITPSDLHTYIPARTSIDHWLLRQPNTTTHYTNTNTTITTHIPEYGDHKALILELPQIGLITTPKSSHKQKNPTTRSQPPFQLPITQNLIDLYQLGNPSTTSNTRHTSQTLNNLLGAQSATTDQIDYAAAQVMTIIHEYHDIATQILPMQTPRSDTTTITQLKPPILRVGLRK
jgi:hypothetical protein